ncbi:MAG: sugar phosphate isomerase/epimerase, partial [Bacteroidota bacterium]
CLDAHWIYRGAGNTTAVLSDVLEKYIDRVVELHLRQSQIGIWTEAFGEGDIDYAAIAAKLKRRNLEPLLVLEQSVEDETAMTMNAVEAHIKSVKYVQELFG